MTTIDAVQLEQVERAISGDRDALRHLWQAHKRWVAAILIAHKPRDADLDDLLQVVALQLVRKVHELRGPEAFRPWLRTVATNTARNEGRKATRRGPTLRLVSDDQHADGDAPSGDREEGKRLLDLARDLPEGYREPLLLRCARGMSYRQIAEITGLPETTIETRIARGRRMLRELAARADEMPRAPRKTTTSMRMLVV